MRSLIVIVLINMAYFSLFAQSGNVDDTGTRGGGLVHRFGVQQGVVVERVHSLVFGTVRSLVNNMIVGVSKGYKKELLIDGVGYKVVMKGANQLVLSLGYSHDIDYEIPEGIKIEVNGQGTGMSIEGIDKQLVGQVAARIRDYSPVEPYKGKGVRYSDEQVRRKEGKAVA